MMKSRRRHTEVLLHSPLHPRIVSQLDVQVKKLLCQSLVSLMQSTTTWVCHTPCTSCTGIHPCNPSRCVDIAIAKGLPALLQQCPAHFYSAVWYNTMHLAAVVTRAALTGVYIVPGRGACVLASSMHATGFCPCTCNSCLCPQVLTPATAVCVCRCVAACLTGAHTLPCPSSV